MKRRLLSLLLVLALVLSGMTVTAAAAGSDPVKITVNGEPVKFDKDLGEPYIDENGRTMVPFRAVANMMENMIIMWEDYAKEASFGHSEKIVDENGETGVVTRMALFPIGTNRMLQAVTVIDMESAMDPNREMRGSHNYLRLMEMDTQSVIKDGRTYAPIRYLAETFGYTVGWDEETRTVTLDNPDTENWDGYLEWVEENQTIIDSRETAEQYIRECIRYGTGDLEPELSYQGFEEIEVGSAWHFSVEMIYYNIEDPEEPNVTYYGTAEFYATERGEIYYLENVEHATLTLF